MYSRMDTVRRFAKFMTKKIHSEVSQTYDAAKFFLY